MYFKRIALGGVITALALFLFFAYVLFRINPWTSFLAQEPLETSVNQAEVIAVTVHPRQTPYDCGAYNIAALLNSFNKEVNLEDVIKANRENMIPRVGVVPEVLVSTLGEYGVDSQIRTFRWLDEDEKIQTLKALLSEDKPIILLVKRHGYLHFVLLTSFEDNEVHLYDPLLDKGESGFTVDRNGSANGNETLLFSDLIDLWDEASVIGFYKNLALIVDKP